MSGPVRLKAADAEGGGQQNIAMNARCSMLHTSAACVQGQIAWWLARSVSGLRCSVLICLASKSSWRLAGHSSLVDRLGMLDTIAAATVDSCRAFSEVPSIASLALQLKAQAPATLCSHLPPWC